MSVEALIQSDLEPIDDRLHQPELRELIEGFGVPGMSVPGTIDTSAPIDGLADVKGADGRPDHGTNSENGTNGENGDLDETLSRFTGGLERELAFYLLDKVEHEAQKIEELHRKNTEFGLAFNQAVGRTEQRERILDFARALGASERQLRGDRRAFDRWFDSDAVIERYQRRVSEAEYRLSFFLDRLGALVKMSLAARPETYQIQLWRRLRLERILSPLFRHLGDKRVATAAFRALGAAVGALSPTLREKAVGSLSMQAILRTAQRGREDAWMQCAALEVLSRIAPDAFRKVVDRRLRHPGEDDDLFVRRHLVKNLLPACLREPRSDDFEALLSALLEDPSPFVRQGLAETVTSGLDTAAARARAARLWPHLALRDPSPQVRAQALLRVPALQAHDELRDEVLRVVVEALHEDPSDFVRRVAMTVAVESYPAWRELDPEIAERWYRGVVPAIEDAHREAPKLNMRRWAAQARERLWLEHTPAARELAEKLRPEIRRTPWGTSRRLPRGLLKGVDDELLGRVMSVLTIDDFGLTLDRGRLGDRLTRAYVLKFRFWRFLFEWRHPKPDKRQAHLHTTGRVHYGQIHAPSAILNELAQTTVPGEPLFIADEAGYRPYLPLLDDVLSGLNQLGREPQTIRFFSSEGVTEMTPPASHLARLKAWWTITRRFPALAELRNWRPGRSEGPDGYLKALEKLGITFRFRPHPPETTETTETTETIKTTSPAPKAATQEPREAGDKGETADETTDADEAIQDPAPPGADPAVWRFFPQILLPAGLGDLLVRLQDYLLSPYENDIFHLTLFISAALAFFIVRHFFANRAQKRARNSIALVVGGWGTRGKSGTERIKAGMFNALGAPLFSKTTGCEAMFVEAPAFGKMVEIFLYRPYDKATIWEQKNVVDIASKVGSRIFLWECMGLTPAYVELLQRHWMRDDISTLTNTYPDHEDLQGPAGYDVAETMVHFIGEGGRVVTTEEHMFPILREGAHAQNTSIRGLGWLESELLTEDILERFPYAEHPMNIALVLALADDLQIDRDFALKEMADRVVPDLGVLRTYPRATVESRTLEFVMGMSANERHGAMGNWTRMGFAEHDLDKEPGLWITTVVNNRADRVPRSQVFAAILAQEISADRHVLIGGNLKGLAGYIRNAWLENKANLTLWREGVEVDGLTGPRAALLELTKKLREPWTPEIIEARLEAMLAEQAEGADLQALRELAAADPGGVEKRLEELELGELAEDIARQLTADVRAHAEYVAFDERLKDIDPESLGDGEREKLDGELEKMAWRWFEKKIFVVEDYYATGNQIIHHIAKNQPPNTLTRIMGMQNIKGTGLDYVYRWEAWRVCWEACQMMLSDEAAEAEQGARELASFRDYGVLTEEYVRQVVEDVRTRPVAQKESFQSDLERILKNLDTAMEAVHKEIGDEEESDGADQDTAGETDESSNGDDESLADRAKGWTITHLEAFLDALFDSIRRRRLSDQLYRDLTHERISRARAQQEMQGTVKRQKGGWLKKALKG